MTSKYSNVENISREYYNSDDADNFYFRIWGGEDIHIGLYDSENDSIYDASRKTVDTMLSMCEELNEESRVVDLGSGYGGSARYIAKEKGCRVTCINISEVENKRNREKNTLESLQDKIEVVDGTFENVPVENEVCDLVWSQDAILHSGEREKVISETARILKSGGIFIFTDPMQKAGVGRDRLENVLNRIHLDTLGSYEFYETAAEKYGLVKVSRTDHSNQLVNHYSHVLDEIKNRYEEMQSYVSREYLDKMCAGLSHWIDAGKNGLLTWGIMKYKKI